MSATTTVSFVAPAAPEGWSAPSTSGASLTVPKQRILLPVGPAYLAHARRRIHKRTISDDALVLEEQQRKLREAQELEASLEDDLGVGDEPESAELLSRDAKEWKGQDHYAVLGLSKFRFKATQDQIKIAHRKKVLKHHPDKKANSGDSDNDQFFKCIQKALEILSNPEKRRQFDSVDPAFQALEDDFDSAELSKKSSKSPEAFFKAFGPIFERNARFSKITPVPLLGAVDDSKASVEGFYDFWYNFDSWRSFEYLDKEVNEGSDSRDDKRYTEKKNKTERARRKKEDNTRVRSLVDIALGLDPRIKRIKQEEKEERERKKAKSGKPSAAAKKEEDERLAKEAAEKAKVDAEADAVAKAEAKKAKAAAATAAKKARRAEKAAAETNGV